MAKKERFQQILESVMNKKIPADVFARLAPPTLIPEVLAQWKKRKK